MILPPLGSRGGRSKRRRWERRATARERWLCNPPPPYVRYTITGSDYCEVGVGLMEGGVMHRADAVWYPETAFSAAPGGPPKIIRRV